MTDRGRPEVVTLCGSTRFRDAFVKADHDLTMQGIIVLSVAFHPDWSSDHAEAGLSSEQRAALDALHKQKIDLSDRILVLNVGGYIGDATRSEIDHATSVGCPVSYLEPP